MIIIFPVGPFPNFCIIIENLKLFTTKPTTPIHKILFVCHDNICHNPMAEFVMKHIVEEQGISNQFEIASAATSTEEIGNPVYPPARRKLAEHGIGCDGITPFVGAQLDICEAFGFKVPEGCSPKYASRKKPGPHRGRPSKPKTTTLES